MKESDAVFAAKYAVGVLNTDDLVQFADSKMNAGEYSDSLLAIIDSEPKVWEEVSGYYKEAMKNSGVIIPTQEEGVWTLLKYHINLITLGKANPFDQFKELLHDIQGFDLHKNITEYVGDNVGIHNMYGWYYEDSATKEEISKGIFEESMKWIEQYAKNH